MRGRRAPVGPVMLTAREILDFLSDPMVFEPGHHLRSGRCIHCGTMIGGQVFRIHQTVNLTAEPCKCGALAGTIFLLCAACSGRPPDEVTDHAVMRWWAYHGGAG